MNNVDLGLLLDDYLEDAAGHLDAVEEALMDVERTGSLGDDGDGLTPILGNLHTLKGNSGMMGLTPMQHFIHRLETTLQGARNGGLAVDGRFFEAFYMAISALRGALSRLADNPADVPDFSSEQLLLDGLTVGEGPASAPSAAREKRDDVSYLAQKSKTLKVNFTRLDDLMNMVGELVTHRTALLALEARLKDTVRDRSIIEAFDASSQAIGKTANDLRETIMKVRMLPIRNVFQRFTRLVRDLSQQHGKEVRLVFEGEETELDKTVIDEIGEPLLHLVRNAVDHGIESPAERRRLGKPLPATLKLRAGHESNHIVIVVEDDGRGIAAGELKKAAEEKGVIRAQEAREMSDQDALQLVFHAGFSTRREVTETSGRGIGLDVVKKTVSSLNGIIDLASVPGAGTRFTIKLPLTLAIIQALMVEVAGETYAIPLSGVLESVRLDAADIHQVAAGEIMRLRDRLVPVVRLDRFFGLSAPAARELEYVVIVGSGEKRGGIVVDRLLGQQEVVIKGMDDYLGALPGISGGTVLGDGRVSLILDIASLMGKTSEGGEYDGTC